MQITYFNKMDGTSNSLQAEFGVHIPKWGITLNKLKLVQSKKGQLFVNAPNFKDGENYSPFWTFDEEHHKRFFDAALKLAKDYLASSNNGVKAPSALDEEAPF